MPETKNRKRAAGHELEFAPGGLAEVCEALVGQRQRAVRLNDRHYLVEWQPKSRVWCVINMAALGEHGRSCAAFRYRKHCDHLDLIFALCSPRTGKRPRPRVPRRPRANAPIPLVPRGRRRRHSAP